jgi:hypothetical protein
MGSGGPQGTTQKLKAGEPGILCSGSRIFFIVNATAGGGTIGKKWNC